MNFKLTVRHRASDGVRPVFVLNGRLIPDSDGLRKTRTVLDLSQSEFAVATGLNLRTLCGWESGKPMNLGSILKVQNAVFGHDARDVAEHVEWSGVGGRCPYCGATPDNGHAPKCGIFEILSIGEKLWGNSL